uniref:Vitellogenin 2 n=1 Tax=Paracyclopina nana TaxID=565004 RepID=D4N2J9_PARNA|nr:vitellogenin 2 [Paracyclopina nana]
MKVFALLFLVGCAFATQSEWRWESGKQHVYEYSGRLLTAIPKLASHYSGIGINATVLVDVLSQNRLQLSVEQPRFARINERLEARLNSNDGPDGANWREVFLPEMAEVDEDLKRILEQPIVFELARGEIREAKISREEPEWSVNFKKALALLFQAKVDTSSWMGEENQINANNDNYWMTKEEGIDGICEVTYQVNEIPKYMIRDRPEYVINHESCPEQKYYSIVKTKNVDNCERRASFNSFKPGSIRCNGPNCEAMWARTSMTRVIACGSRGNLVIQTIVNQGELNQNLLGVKTERFVSGNLQYLRLKEIKSASPKPHPQDLTELKSMMYEYSYRSYQNDQQQREEERGQERITRHVAQDPEQLAKALPKSKLTGQKNVPKAKIIEEVKRILQSLMTELENPGEEDLVKKQVTMKILSVSRGLTMLTKSKIKAIYREMKAKASSSSRRQEESFKSLFFDTVLMSGSQEAVFFLKDQIQSGEVNTVEIISLLMWMPNALMFPTEEVLEAVFEITKAPKVESCPFTKATAIMSLTTIVKKACLSKERDLSYPTWVFGKFCSPESRFVREKFLPYLTQELESSQSWAKRNEIIVALGMLPHEQVIGKLVPFLEGRIQTQEPVPRLTRLLALWSLATSGDVQPQVVEPIFFAIFSNPAEATEMRISAFNALLKMNPSVAVFHKIVAKTWTEEDQEVLKVVNIALATLAQERKNEQLRPLDLMDLSMKARMVFPLIKKVRGIYPTSAVIYTSDHLSKLGVGYEGLTSWIASNSSFVPVEMYSEITYYLSQFKFRPIAAGLRLQGAENLLNKAAQILTPLKPGQNAEEQEREFARKVQENLHSEWRKVIEKLGINARNSDNKISGSFFLNIMESTPLFMNFEHLTTQTLKEQAEKLMRSPNQIKEILSEEKPFSCVSALDMANYEAVLPTDMGFPLLIEVHMPVILSLQGKMRFELSLNKPSMIVDTKVFYTSQYSGMIGTTIPFTKEYAVTAVDETIVYNVPATISAQLDLPNQHVRLAFKINENSRKAIDMAHYHIHPYTAIQKIDDLTPVTLVQSKKLIRSEDELKERSMTFGEYLGLHFTSKISTESRYLDFKSAMERLQNFNYNPINMVRFSWVFFGLDAEARPSIRRHEYSLRFDPSQSSTKELAMDLKVGYASKDQPQEPVHYKKIRIASRQEQEQENRLIPLTVESEQVESKNLHPQRQHKIAEALRALNDVERAQAITFKYTTTLMGSRPRSWSYSATLVTGQAEKSAEKKVDLKWNIELESEETRNKIVIKGNTQAPILPIWNVQEIRSSLVDFRYFNTIEWIANGAKEWSIDVHGNAKVSHEQKEHSRVSQAAKQCQRQHERKQVGQPAILARLSEACEAQRQQARTLDEVDFTIKYNNVPRKIESYESTLVSTLKTWLWTYMKVDKEHMSNNGQNNLQLAPVLVRLQFHRETPSFDLVISRAEEKIVFQKVRLARPFAGWFPLKAGINNIKELARQVTGQAVYPTCKVEGQTLRTFDNKSMPFHIDYCFHLLSGDCSSAHKFSVLTRVMRPGNRRELQVFLGRSMLVLTPAEKPSMHSPFPSMKVTVEGEEQILLPNKWIELRSPETRQELGQIVKSQDNVIRLRAPKYDVEVIFNGDDISIETSESMKGSLCGLCGNFNRQRQDEIQGPNKCMYSRPEVEAAAYRVNNSPAGCQQEKPLSASVEQRLERENQQCLRERQIPTKISKSLRTQNGQCTVLKHVIVKRPNQVCISMKAVTQCSPGCQASHAELLNKKIPFTCLAEDRVAEHYVKKANRGQRMSELEARPLAFEIEVPQPRSCVRASNEL